MITAFLVMAAVSRLEEVMKLAVYGLPGHDIICDWGGRDTGWWIGLHALEVAHQASPRGGRHVAR
jgi:hypothetical protein